MIHKRLHKPSRKTRIEITAHVSGVTLWRASEGCCLSHSHICEH